MNIYKRMEIVCRSIPYGRVASYGQIAFLCGAPRNARQVGYALRTDKLGKNIPAHRIVNSKGQLSGAWHFGSSDLQKELLESEGIELYKADNLWCLDIEKCIWKPCVNAIEQMKIKFEEAEKEPD